ncbi:MAG: hypothetical protein OXK77_14325 [Gemmatimonadota bacterium]|nr:hypothetical protein [Gemmatimonadota bacterium]MYB07135.1 hypothetical protein [Gemmatimonadota bacterium]
MFEDRTRRQATAVALTLGLAVAVFLTAPAHAQVRAGGHGVYKSQAFDGTFGVGARAEIDLDFVRPGLMISGIYDRLFPGCDDCSSSEYGGQILLGATGPLYFGVGAAYRLYEGNGGETAARDSGDWAFNYAAGLRLRGVPVIVPYIEFRQEFGSDTLNEQTFSAGILLSPTGSRPAPRRPFTP